MKKIVVLLIISYLMLNATTLFGQEHHALYQTEDSSSTTLTRSGSKFVTNRGSSTQKHLTNVQVEQMFSTTQYQQYLKAHRCYVAAIPLWAVSGGCLTASAFCGYIGYSIIHGDPETNAWASIFSALMGSYFYVLSGITATACVITFIPATALTVYGKHQLNNLADHYQPNKSLSLRAGMYNGGIGLALNF